MSEWMPIATAPRDGTWVWAFMPGVVVPQRKGKRTRKTLDRQASVRWVENPEDGDGFHLSDHAKELRDKHGGFWSGEAGGRRPTANLPTHWRYLPEPPEAA